MATPPSILHPSGQYVQDRISAGVSAGIITADQALALRQLPLDCEPDRFLEVVPGDEPFALFRGFRDIFLAVGLTILTTGLFTSTALLFGYAASADASWSGVLTAGALALTAWALAEWVTARLRMPLSSLVLCIAFALGFSIFGIMIALFSELVDEPNTVLYLSTLLVAFGSALFYARFRLPFAMAVIAASLAFFVYRLIDQQTDGQALDAFRLYGGLIGLAIFVVAMIYELKDPARKSRFAENAFWLHLLSAPLLIYALTGGLGVIHIGSALEAVRIIFIVLVLGTIALAIDRRAFIVSALVYLASAIAYAINQSGLPSNIQFSLTALALGLLVVTLALGWQPLRRAFLTVLPVGLSSRLPNPVGRDALGG